MRSANDVFKDGLALEINQRLREPG